jgi:sulfotransferase family protein
MLGRQFLTADIDRTDAASVIRMSKPGDFSTGPYRAISRESLLGEMAFPYVIDIARKRTLYVRGLDARKLSDAPFVNVYARSEAKSILSVPWEAGPINRPRIDTAPLYVFSSGRCGSTLLHAILVAARIRSVSEPDVATALISPTYINSRLMRPLLRWTTRNYARDLVNALGCDREPFVVKLRSQFCAAAPALLKGAREKRTIFMTRQFDSWAQSISQMFTVSPAYLIKEYRRSLICFAYLRQNGNCHFLRYENLLSQPHREMARLSEFLGRPIPDSAVDQAMGVRSQEGTRLVRPPEQGMARWNAMRDDVFRLWSSSGSDVFCEEILRQAPASLSATI